MNPFIRDKTKLVSFLIASVVACCGVLPKKQAVVPPTEGGYPGFNTAEGQNALFSLTTGVGNAAIGWYSLFSNTDGSFNTALGTGALLFNVGNQSKGEGTENTAIGTAALLFNVTGANNTAIGSGALENNTADNNTATGESALSFNTTGEANSALGVQALFGNTTGSANTAIGDAALFTNTTGSDNTAIGTAALFFNTTGRNTAIGSAALFNNTIGAANTATGYGALENNTGGNSNTATGHSALLNNAMGSSNTAIGNRALLSNTEGDGNTGVGYQALEHNTTSISNTAVGVGALQTNTTGDGNTALGRDAGLSVTGSNNVCIGRTVHGDAGVDDTTWIRNVNTLTQNFSAGVNDYVTVRLSDGRLGHTAVVSSRRYKEDIKPLEAVSETLYSLKPVSFRLKKQCDETQALGFGLIAEEVEKVDPALVYRNNKGEVESVRYEMVNAMLLNEFLKEHRKNEKQEATIACQQKQIDALNAALRKVSVQLQLSKPAPQTVLNNE